MRVHDIGKLVHSVVMALVKANTSIKSSELIDAIKWLVKHELSSKSFLSDNHGQFLDIVSSVVHNAIPIFEVPLLINGNR